MAKKVTKITSVKDLVQALTEQGFTVEKARNGHWKVRNNGHIVMSMPATPSDPRSVRNTVSDLRKHGFVPPKPN